VSPYKRITWTCNISNSISLNQKRASEGLGVVSANPVIPGVFLPPFCCLLIVFREPGLLGAHERFICFLTWTCLLPLFGPLVSHGLLNVFPVCADYFGLFSLLDGGLPGERTSYDIFLLCAALLLTCWHPHPTVIIPLLVQVPEYNQWRERASFPWMTTTIFFIIMTTTPRAQNDFCTTSYMQLLYYSPNDVAVALFN